MTEQGDDDRTDRGGTVTELEDGDRAGDDARVGGWGTMPELEDGGDRAGGRCQSWRMVTEQGDDDRVGGW